jgi:hypothetical protein
MSDRHDYLTFDRLKDSKRGRAGWFGPNFKLHMPSLTDENYKLMKKPQDEDFSAYVGWSSGAELQCYPMWELQDAFTYYYDKANYRYFQGLFGMSSSTSALATGLSLAVPTMGISAAFVPLAAGGIAMALRTLRKCNESKAKAAAIWAEMDRRGMPLEPHSTGRQVMAWIKGSGIGAAKMVGGKVFGAIL